MSTKSQGKQRFKFVGDTIAELRKVAWPTRQEATYLTTIVIIVTIIMAIILWLFDMGFAELMNIILLGD
ncbi:MAG: preprotein translocase subunit SecE [Dehalococcoidia bacterium]|nr:MAG: preprotein translocase subunit SecE [Dehalococcoidia bacterium]UCG82650.1 MAG: preprotein translocase subunit SecE [Dehalococcoidia bacterium]